MMNLRVSLKRALSMVMSAVMAVTVLAAFFIATAPAANAVSWDPLTCQVNAASGDCGGSATAQGWSASYGKINQHLTGPTTGGSVSGNGVMYYSGYCTYGQNGNGTGGGTGGTSAEAGANFVYPTAPGAISEGATAHCYAPNGTVSTTTPPNQNPVVQTQGITCLAKQVNGVWTLPISVYARTTNDKGWQPVPGSNPKSWQSQWDYACAYPGVPPTSMVTKQPPYGNGVCIISGEYYVMESGSASIANSGDSASKGGGTQLDDSGLISEPFKQQYPGMVCTPTMKSSWASQKLPASNNGVPLYGFYRVAAHITYKTCALNVPWAWTNDKPRVECGKAQREWQHQRYTYTCIRGLYEASGPNGGTVNESDSKYFDPKTCGFALNPNPYTCNIPQTTIAKQTTAVSVMRNGANTPVAFGKLTVSGKVRNVHTQQRATYVVNGSSPYNGNYSAYDSNVGSANQFFELSTDKAAQHTIPFGTPTSDNWQNISNVGNNGYIFYYWASDPGKTWQMSSKYRFVGQIQIVAQDRFDSAPYRTWSPDLTLGCDNQSTSPKVTVLRSVNEQ